MLSATSHSEPAGRFKLPSPVHSPSSDWPSARRAVGREPWRTILLLPSHEHNVSESTISMASKAIRQTHVQTLDTISKIDPQLSQIGRRNSVSDQARAQRAGCRRRARPGYRADALGGLTPTPKAMRARGPIVRSTGSCPVIQTAPLSPSPSCGL